MWGIWGAHHTKRDYYIITYSKNRNNKDMVGPRGYGGRATLCQKRDMAERGLDPLLPRISKRTINEKNSKNEKAK